MYLNREFGLESLEFRPYNLVVVRREDSNPEHYTMSAEGVVHITPGQPAEFTSLAQWMRESTLFNVLTRIRFFKNFLIGKAFREWRSSSVVSFHSPNICLRRSSLYFLLLLSDTVWPLFSAQTFASTVSVALDDD